MDLSLFHQFFVWQDKRNPPNLINAGYYNKQNFANLSYSMSNCLTLLTELNSLNKQLRLVEFVVKIAVVIK